MVKRSWLCLAIVASAFGCSNPGDRIVGSILVGDAPTATSFYLGINRAHSTIHDCKSLSVTQTGDWVTVECELTMGGKIETEYPRERVREVSYIDGKEAARRLEGSIQDQYSSK